MPLAATARMVLDQLAAENSPLLSGMSVAEARRSFERLVSAQGEPEPVGRVEDRRIPGPAGEIPVRVYTPSGTGPWAALVFLHGGGWVLGDLDTHDATCRAIARRTPAVVVAVGYRLAPEHKFPAAAEDAHAATRWVAEHAAALGGDPHRVAVGGDSAGGNLAAVAALMARDRGGPALSCQVLVYPATDAAMDTVSYHDNADGYLLTPDAMVWFWGQYLRGPDDRTDPYASPLRASVLRGLPPALVLTAEFDPLRDEGEAYVARLREEGVSVRLTRYPGMIHVFLSMPAVFPEAGAAIDEVAAALRAAPAL